MYGDSLKRALTLAGCLLMGILLAAPVWETGQYAPASWQPLTGRNLLSGLNATLTGAYYSESGRCVVGAPLTLLTDGNVPGETCDYSRIVGLTNGAMLDWSFAEPMSLSRLRVCSRWGDAGRDGIAISSVQVQYSGSSSWLALPGVTAISYATGGSSGNWEGTSASYAMLADSTGAALADGVVALRLVFGTQDNNGAGYVEVEAMGSPATSEPIINAYLAGAEQNRASFCAEMSWCGLGARSADVYLAWGPADRTLPAPTLIAEGLTSGAVIRHQVEELTSGEHYAYSLFASNDLGRVSSVVSGTFTTLAGEMQSVRINEVMASADVDWFELRNPNPVPIDLSGWLVTDDPSKKIAKWKVLPIGTSVPANGYLVVYADGQTMFADGKAHVDMGLSAVGESVALAKPDGTLVSRVDFPEQLDDISYGWDETVAGGAWRYYSAPTPGSANGAGKRGPTPAPTFSVPHGYRTAAFDLQLSCTELPDVPIYFTTDGKAPTTASTRYTSPIHVASNVVVRAMVYDPEAVLMRGSASTYIFLDQVLAKAPSTTSPGGGFPASAAVNKQQMRYGMRQDLLGDATARAKILRGFTNSIATISIAIDPENLFNASTGIYVNISKRGREWERSGMVEQIDPVHGETNEFVSPVGLRMRGAASRTSNYPKHSFRMFFRSEYGRKTLVFPFFGEEGAGTYRRMDLRTSQNYSWANNPNESYSWMRDAFVTETFERDAQRDLGLPYTRSRYYNLFINGEYWGVYQTQERVDEHFAASYLGGDSDDYDTYNVNTLNSGSDTGRSTLYNLMTAGFADNANYQRAQGNNADGTRKPDYPVLLDVTNLVLRTLIGHYAADGDSPCSIWGGSPNNYFAFNSHMPDSTGFKWFCHDGEHALGMGEGHARDKGIDATVACNPVSWGVYSGIGKFNSHWLNYTLMSNPEYRIVWSDMVERHLKRSDGQLSTSANLRRFQSRMAEIDDAIVCEAARWGRGGQTYATWTTACNYIMDNFIKLRNEYLLGHYRTAGWYRDAPTISVSGDSSDWRVVMTSSDVSIHYTLDGSDPRLYGGAVSTSAITYAGEIAVGTARPRVLARSRDASGNWSALAELDLANYRAVPDAVSAFPVYDGEGSLDHVLVTFAKVEEESRLFMVWGEEDAGENVADWGNSICLGAVMPGTGAVRVGAPSIYAARQSEFGGVRFFLSRGTYEGTSTSVERIRANGTQRIALGYVPTASTRCQLRFSCAVGNGGQYLGTEDKKWRFFSSRDKGSESAYVDINGGRIYGNYIPSKEAVYEYEIGDFYLKNLADGTTLMSGNAVALPSGYSQPLYLFSLTSAGSYCYGDVYYLKIYEGTQLVRDFVPAKNAEGVVGLQERCEGRFYAPATGSFPDEGGLDVVGISQALSLDDVNWKSGKLTALAGDLAAHLRVAEVMSVPVLGGSDGEEYVVLTNLNTTVDLHVGGARVTCTKTGDSVAKCDFELPMGEVIPAGGSKVCRKAEYWPEGKISDGSVDVVVRDAWNETVQRLCVSTKWEGNRFRMCDGKGASFVAVDFSTEVLEASGWRPSIPDIDDKPSRQAVAAAIVQTPGIQSWLSAMANEAASAAAICAWRGDVETLTTCYLVNALPEADPEVELRITAIAFDTEGQLVLALELRQHGEVVSSRQLNGTLRLLHYDGLEGGGLIEAALPAVRESIEAALPDVVELGKVIPVPAASLKLAPPVEGQRHFFRLRISSSGEE